MARYEVCVSGHLSEPARNAFASLEVRTVPPHTTLLGVFPDQADLHSLLALCSDLGLEVLSLQRLPD
jgi:hypothetical protein